MNGQPLDLPTAWSRFQTGLDSLLAERTGRSARIAERLASLVPAARRAACQLDGEEAPEGPDRALLAAPPADDAVARLPSGALAAAVRCGERTRGWLALDLPPDLPTADAERAAALVFGCARVLALTLERDEARAAEAELAGLATVGEAASGLAHEFNNVLNTMVLQAAGAEMNAPEALRPDLVAIRQQGKAAANLLRPLQQARQVREPADLNAALRGALLDGPEAVPVELDLAEGLPPLSGPRGGLKRLVRHLLTAAIGSATERLCVRTVRRGPGVALVLEGDGPGRATYPFEAEAESVGQADEIARLAGQSVLRQWRATLTVEARPGGWRWIVAWAGDSGAVPGGALRR